MNVPRINEWLDYHSFIRYRFVVGRSYSHLTPIHQLPPVIDQHDALERHPLGDGLDARGGDRLSDVWRVGKNTSRILRDCDCDDIIQKLFLKLFLHNRQMSAHSLCPNSVPYTSATAAPRARKCLTS